MKAFIVYFGVNVNVMYDFNLLNFNAIRIGEVDGKATEYDNVLKHMDIFSRLFLIKLIWFIFGC